MSFPPRNEALDFRQKVLEVTYRDLGRPLQMSFVNMEGMVVWTQEYLRYRVNGCDHLDAVNRVVAQIDGSGIAPVCNPNITGTPAFPPRSESVDFRQRLEMKYRDQLRASPTQTFVDLEGEIIWTQEFVRYRASGCSNIATYERVLIQINGREAPADCQAVPPPTCTYSVSPTSQNVVAAGGSLGASVAADPASCTWALASNVPWVTIPVNAGSGSAPFTYIVGPTVASAARTGRITLTGTSGSAMLDVTQSGATAPPTCSYVVSPTSFQVVPGGGEFDVNVTTSAGCSWTANALSSLVTVVSGSAGVGSGTARFSVVPTTFGPRTAFARIAWEGAQQQIVFNQAAGVPPPPVAKIQSPGACEVDTACKFDGSSSQGIIGEWIWDFGDGSKGTGPVVNHTYSANFVASFGSTPVTVSLTVQGPYGTSTATVTVTVFRFY